MSSRTPSTMSNFRPDGYVNWSDTHYYIKTKQWQPLHQFVYLCDKIERETTTDTARQLLIEPELNPGIVIDENTRFPKDKLYINTSHPAVLSELLYIYMQKGPKEGLLRGFIDKTKDQVHTRNSFEEKYGLKWVDPTEGPEVTTEPNQECGPLATNMQVSEETTGLMQEQVPFTNMQVTEIKTESMHEQRAPLSNPQHTPGVMDQKIADSAENPIIGNENLDDNDLKTQELKQKLSKILDKVTVSELHSLLQALKTVNKWLHPNWKNYVHNISLIFPNISDNVAKNKCMVLYDELSILEISNEKQAEIFVDTLFSWSLTIEEPYLTVQFAMVFHKLCLDKSSSDDKYKFRKLFLDKCQSQFENIISINYCSMNIKIMNGINIKPIATIRLIGHLYIANMFTTKIIEDIVRQLTKRLDEKEHLEYLYELIQIIGERLQKEKSKELHKALRRMVQYIEPDKITSRIQSMINKAME